MISFQDVLSAENRIREYIYTTPLDLSYQLSDGNTGVYLKLECQQRLKSFKVRGALSKIISLTEKERSRGVMAVSSGNHGAGVSYASYVTGGVKAKIFVPKTTPLAKIEKIKYYGADVIQIGENYDETHNIAMKAMESENLTFVDPCSDEQVISGQGTIGIEILKQNPQIDVIIVPVGGGGLITGIGIAAKHLKPSIKVIGVQTAACPAMIQSLKDKICYLEYPIGPTICDALVGGVGEIPYKMAGQCVDDIIEVDEAAIKRATRLLMINDKVLAEPSGAVGVAAFLEHPELFRGRNVAIVISGGNLDAKLMKEILDEE